jgi:uncharacterized protein (DUF58 family)
VSVVREFFRKLKFWFRPPRRLKFTRSGGLLTGAIVALGFATLNTGNNLLYLVLGGLLGLIMLSGWLSEQVLRRILIRRRLPRAGVAGQPVRVGYELTNLKRRFPSIAVEFIENGATAPAFLTMAAPGKTAAAWTDLLFPRRGVYRLDEITARTRFPFGLFVKERDLSAPVSLIVWPRADRTVRSARRGGERVRRIGTSLNAAPGAARGEYRSLRQYRPGDDPRDVHWRSSARRNAPVVREYERDSADTLWLCLDLRSVPGDEAELACEITATLAARAARLGERFGLATNEIVIDAGTGAGQLEAVFDALARVAFRPSGPTFNPPTDPAHCVLITAGPGNAAAYADHFTAADA